MTVRMSMEMTWAPAVRAWTRWRQRQVGEEVEVRGRTMTNREMKPSKSVFHLWNASYFTRAYLLIFSQQSYVVLEEEKCPLCQDSERLTAMTQLLDLILGWGAFKTKLNIGLTNITTKSYTTQIHCN